MENQKKSKGMTALVVLLLIVTIAALVLATYAWAKYTSSTNNTATAQVAKWNVTFTPDNNSFIGTYSHVVPERIAPGMTGTFDITVVPNDTEVCFNYEIKIDSVQFLGDGDTVLPDSTVLDGTITLADFRSHITFKDSSNTDLTNGTNTIHGTFDLGTHNTAPATSTGVNTVTWSWPYNTTDTANMAAYDAIDTAAGKYAAAHTFKMKVNYTVTATQVQPTAN